MKEFKAPEINVTRFAAEDILVASSAGTEYKLNKVAASESPDLSNEGEFKYMN